MGSMRLRGSWVKWKWEKINRAQKTCIFRRVHTRTGSPEVQVTGAGTWWRDGTLVQSCSVTYSWTDGWTPKTVVHALEHKGSDPAAWALGFWHHTWGHQPGTVATNITFRGSWSLKDDFRPVIVVLKQNFRSYVIAIIKSIISIRTPYLYLSVGWAHTNPKKGSHYLCAAQGLWWYWRNS